jgi:hypothetical protein
MLYVDLESGKCSLLALEEDLAAVAAERVGPKEEGEVRRHELGAPAALALHTVGILKTLEEIALLAAAAGRRRAVLASNYPPLLVIRLEADRAGLGCCGRHFGRVLERGV